MPKKTHSEIYQTFPTRSESGDEEFGNDRIQPRQLPRDYGNRSP